MTLHYKVELHNPEAHEFRVVLEIAEPQQEGQELTLPSWIPGSYMIRDFAKNMLSIKAFDRHGPVSLSKLDKQTWRAAKVEGALRVEYHIYAWDLSVRSAHFDNTHAYFNGTSMFLRVVGQEERPHEVTLVESSHFACKNWTVSTTLPQRDVGASGFGLYCADNYDALIDFPVEIGSQYEFSFDVKDIPHRMALTEAIVFDEARLKADLEKICTVHVDMFGELPLTQYLFMVLCVGDGYGGLEHKDSTSLMCKRTDLPVPGADSVSKDYRQFLGLCSHEYFHLWNVKRIQPEVVAKADLSKEAHTELLWAFEGITSYYDDLALVRSGCIKPSEYLDTLATTITRIVRGAGKELQSVADSSFDTWTKFYKQDENAPNAIVSYYAKGALVALGLDLEMRTTTNNRVCLDDLMRLLWQRHGKPGIGVPERGIESLVSELCGTDFSAFFAKYVYGTDELPLSEWLEKVGVSIQFSATSNINDTGSYVDSFSDEKPVISLGLRSKATNGQPELVQVFTEGASQAAGLAPGDIILSIDNEQVTAGNITDFVQRYKEGDESEIHFFRRQRLQSLTLKHQNAKADTCRLTFLADDSLTQDQRNWRHQWFGQDDIC